MHFALGKANRFSQPCAGSSVREFLESEDYFFLKQCARVHFVALPSSQSAGCGQCYDRYRQAVIEFDRVPDNDHRAVEACAIGEHC